MQDHSSEEGPQTYKPGCWLLWEILPILHFLPFVYATAFDLVLRIQEICSIASNRGAELHKFIVWV